MAFVRDIKILFVITPGFAFLIIYKSNVNDEEIRRRYGSLFLEFKLNKGFKALLFYPLFFLRRVIYVLTQVFLNEMPILQVFLHSFFTFVQLSYCIIFRPFIEGSMFISEVTGEVCTLIVFISTSFFVDYGGDVKVDLIESITEYCLLIAFIVQMLVCVYTFIAGVVELVKKIYKHRTVQVLRSGNSFI